MLEQFEHAIGCAGREHSAADYKATDIVKVEAVDVLVRRYGMQDTGHVEGRRQRQLNKYAVDGRIVVQLRNLGDDLVLFDIDRIIESKRPNADIGAGADLVLHIDFRGWIGADE